MRKILSAVLLSSVALSAPALARTHKRVAENTAPSSTTEVKPSESKSSAPSGDGKSVRPRKTKRARSTTEVKPGSGEVKPSESKGAVPAEAPGK